MCVLEREREKEREREREKRTTTALLYLCTQGMVAEEAAVGPVFELATVQP